MQKAKKYYVNDWDVKTHMNKLESSIHRFAFNSKKIRSTNESSKRSDEKTFDCNFNFVLFR